MIALDLIVKAEADNFSMAGRFFISCFMDGICGRRCGGSLGFGMEIGLNSVPIFRQIIDARLPVGRKAFALG